MPSLTNIASAETLPPDLDACKDVFIIWYKDVFGFTDKVAKVLYDEQLLHDKNTLAELSNSKIDNVMCAICRTQAIAKLLSARLKLATFWIKHQDRTQRQIGGPYAPLVKVGLDTMMLLKTQKQLEDELRLGNKEPDYPAQTLDLASAAKTFDKTRTILSRVRGVTGVPLSYVIRNILYPHPARVMTPPLASPTWYLLRWIIFLGATTYLVKIRLGSVKNS